jgi:hypothetical protein
MKIELVFLHGLMTEEAGTAPLVITGDENSITLTKGDKFDEWLNNATLVKDPDSPGGVSNIAALNRRTLNEAIESWLNGEEYGRQVWAEAE